GRQATATDLQICRTDAGHIGLDPDLAFRRLRHRNLRPLENARRAVLRKNAGTGHVQAPSGDCRGIGAAAAAEAGGALRSTARADLTNKTDEAPAATMAASVSGPVGP